MMRLGKRAARHERLVRSHGAMRKNVVLSHAETGKAGK